VVAVRQGLLSAFAAFPMVALTSGASMAMTEARAGKAPLPALQVTLYYTALEADYARGTDAAFRDRSGIVLRRGSAEFVAAAAIEGSVRFDDGEVLNYDRRIGSEVRWLRTEAQLGLDARGCELVPYRSAAVDPQVVPLGTLMLLEETRNMPLPDGSLHDGIWLAADTGDAILGYRIDLYTGAGMATMSVPRTFGIGHLQALTAWNIGMAESCASPLALPAAD
jgi:3D (Asp-Asp-Asp) domain-containing protein